MDTDRLFSAHKDTLEDFWGRRESAPCHDVAFSIFGRSVRLLSNHPVGEQAAERSRHLFSDMPSERGRSFVVQIVVRPGTDGVVEPPPDFLSAIQYTGHGRWLAMHLGRWGQCSIDLSRRRAVVIIVPELAAKPDLVSRTVLNTVLLNLLIGDGYGMLHATGLVRDDRLLLLLGTHNVGKSTTALHLAVAGHRIMSDSQIHVAAGDVPLRLLGFPVGLVHLRPDMVALFPPFGNDAGTRVEVRGETKLALDLRRVAPELVEPCGVSPARVDICRLRRGPDDRTRAEPASHSDVTEAVMRNSLYYDDAESWRRNLEPIQRLLERAHLHHLVIGTNPAGIVAGVDALASV